MVNIPWGPVGYLTYKRTYSRRLVESDINSPTEEYPATVERIIAACDAQLRMNLSEEKKEYIRYIHLNMKGSVAGRFLWQLGTDTVDRLGLFSLQNCAAVVVDSPIDPFTWTMDALMLGSGVGYNIQKEHVYELPKVKGALNIVRRDTKDADFIVPDSREGWVELLRQVLLSYFKTGKSFSYSTILIRGKGAPIKGFGGLASGPEELCWGIDKICSVLNKRAKKKLNPIDVLDIMNIIGYIVVAGNVRRSAQIALGDYDDMQYLSAKRWDLGNVPNWRAMSNNSVVCNQFDKLPEQFWLGYQGNGEPYGLINLRLAQSMGRTGETQYPDKGVMIFNPCAEQSLNNMETCCLAEIFLPNISSKGELFKVAATLYEINKHSLRLPCHQPVTEKVVHENMRMGIGITGFMQASKEQKEWLPSVYEQLREYDKEYSAKMGWPPSIKLTTVKPSGTMSLLPGVTPGCHPGYSQYFIRRIRVASNSPLLNVCISHGYHVEPQYNFDGTPDNNTYVVSFPCSYPKGTQLSATTSAIEQLETVSWLQKNWSDNAVSCTVYYKKEELPGIREWLQKNYDEKVKTCSFLLHSDHGFKQAPYEEISEDEYLSSIAKVRPISSLSSDTSTIESECEGGACPVR
jgi:ribonucleoside-triphosphate reductase